MTLKPLVLALALAPLGAAAQPTAAPPPTATATARAVVEKQLEPRGIRPPGMSGAEAKVIRDRYLQSIGRMLETDRINAGSTPR